MGVFEVLEEVGAAFVDEVGEIEAHEDVGGVVVVDDVGGDEVYALAVFAVEVFVAVFGVLDDFGVDINAEAGAVGVGVGPHGDELAGAAEIFPHDAWFGVADLFVHFFDEADHDGGLLNGGFVEFVFVGIFGGECDGGFGFHRALLGGGGRMAIRVMVMV